ncbi:putative FecR, ferric citrate sensor [Nitrospira sp. KM1]|uniref:FecR family protein n=1 Tax=Nitrospira sp. KM1 TaxID=1936990 RepID=UPI0013A7A5AC|nr:FecR domain-containing protein [Nitrospira sp. KM1]BCA57168.1 putative FecR, ferric citrate sensor [Nitrospira sp. KM1]
MRVTEKQSGSSSRSIREQAIDWCLHLESQEANAHDRLGFEAWLREDPVHRQEYEEAAKVWSDIDQVKPLWAEARRRAVQHAAAVGSDQPFDPPRPRLLGWHGWAPVMGIVLAVCAFTFWWIWEAPAPMQHYRTAKGEQHTLRLEDGSTVVMNTDSALTVQLSKHKRMVTLQQGEALFTVSHDEQRPFTVIAKNGLIRDIGTQFLIHAFPEHVEVSVLEGVVEVDIPNAKTFTSRTGKLQRLAQGEYAEYTSAGQLSSVHAFDAETALAWTRQLLVFNNAPLEEVLKEWGRYRTEELRLLSSNLRTLPVNGKFRIDHMESFLQALEEALAIKAHRVNANLIILDRQLRS